MLYDVVYGGIIGVHPSLIQGFLHRSLTSLESGDLQSKGVTLAQHELNVFEEMFCWEVCICKMAAKHPREFLVKLGRVEGAVSHNLHKEFHIDLPPLDDSETEGESHGQGDDELVEGEFQGCGFTNGRDVVGGWRKTVEQREPLVELFGFRPEHDNQTPLFNLKNTPQDRRLQILPPTLTLPLEGGGEGGGDSFWVAAMPRCVLPSRRQAGVNSSEAGERS